MKTFKDLVFLDHPVMPGLRATYYFENGYGVSVVRFKSMIGGGYGSYTNNETEWEVAILKGTPDDWTICYDTGITDDVIGHLTDGEVTQVMILVQELQSEILKEETQKLLE